MPNTRRMLMILLLLTVIGFVSGLIHLLFLRFEAGDVYPAYSSHRADPLGTKVLYESLGNLEGITVTRNYRQFPRPPDPRNTTLFVFGVRPEALSFVNAGEVNAMEDFLVKGGRLVLLVLPQKRRSGRERGDAVTEDKKAGSEGQNDEKLEKKPEDRAQKENTNPEQKTQEKTSSGTDDDKIAFLSLHEKWKFRMQYDEAAQEQGEVSRVQRVHPDTGLPESLSWHSILSFKDTDSSWRLVYAKNERPVLIERPYGRGSIVLATDTYFVSNEALQKERHPDLLAWIAGSSTHVIFDETVHGIVENPGVASLGRKYRLHGLFAGILILTLLFIWKQMVSLVPAEADVGQAGRQETAAAGKDTLSGFVGLLRRTIPVRAVLGVCVEEWKNTMPRRRGDDTALISRMQAMANEKRRKPATNRDLVDAYQKICRLLAERKRI